VATAIRKATKPDGRPLSSSTAHRTHVVLMKMLRDAKVEGHDIAERLLVVDAPTAAASTRTAIGSDDARRLLTEAAELDDGSRWVAALLQGMRQGECLGLTWDCVDLDGGTVDVSWQLQAVPFEHGCTHACGKKKPGGCPARRYRVPDGYEIRPLEGALSLVRPKTAKGQRIVPLVPWMTAALAAWRAAAPSSRHRLVWPRPDGRPRLAPDDLDERKALQCMAGVGHPDGRYYHLHEARHTTATLLLEAGIDPEIIKAILGHASIITSRGYQHVSQVLARQAMEAVATRLGLVSGGTVTVTE
jgi:integrase